MTAFTLNDVDEVAATLPGGLNGLLKHWGLHQFGQAVLARHGMADAYAGAREDLEVWKRRALAAEAQVRDLESKMEAVGAGGVSALRGAIGEHDRNSVLEEAAALMDKTSRSSAAALIRGLKATHAAVPGGGPLGDPEKKTGIYEPGVASAADVAFLESAAKGLQEAPGQVDPRVVRLFSRLESYRVAFDEWIQKTDFIQDWISSGKLPAKYLGWHRADVMRDLIKEPADAPDQARSRAQALASRPVTPAASAEPMRMGEPAALAAPKGEAMDDVLNDALSNLEHDNYERSHKGYENRQADVALIRATLASAPAADERCKRCGGPGWYTSHTTGYPESIPCSACNPQGVSVERLAKDPFLVAQLWRKPEDFADAYEGAREDLAIWKRRALEAERDLRAERETSSRLVAALNAESGPTHMGERAALASAPVAGEAKSSVRSLQRYGFGYADDGNGGRYLSSLKRDDGAFLLRDDVIAALASGPAAQPPQDSDVEMVSMGGTAPAVPRWLLDAAQRIQTYMDAHSPGAWAVGGIQKRQAPAADGRDAKDAARYRLAVRDCILILRGDAALGRSEWDQKLDALAAIAAQQGEGGGA